MDKAQRRKKRKDKERQRDHDRACKAMATQKASASVREALLLLYRLAAQEYPALVGVFEVDSRLNLQDQETIDHLGLGDRYKVLYFDTLTDDGYSSYKPAATGNLSMGGYTQAVTDAKGERRIVVSMKRHREKPHLSDLANLGLFLHELGHVDDITRGLNLVFDRNADLEAAELHAHEFACRRLMQYDQRVPLAMYVNGPVEQLAAASVPSIANAAKRFKASETYRQAKTFLGSDANTYGGYAATVADRGEGAPV